MREPAGGAMRLMAADDGEGSDMVRGPVGMRGRTLRRSIVIRMESVPLEAIPSPGGRTGIRIFPSAAFQPGYATQPRQQADGKGDAGS
jgi:hypothetical protein